MTGRIIILARIRFVSMFAAACVSLAVAVPALASPGPNEQLDVLGGRTLGEIRDDLKSNLYLNGWLTVLGAANADGLCEKRDFDNPTLVALGKIQDRYPVEGIESPSKTARYMISHGTKWGFSEVTGDYTNEFRHKFCASQEIKNEYENQKKTAAENGGKVMFETDEDILKVYYAQAIDYYKVLVAAGVDVDAYFKKEKEKDNANKLVNSGKNMGETIKLKECYLATWTTSPEEIGTMDEEEDKAACKDKKKDDE
ncbi:hypothetical protein ACFWF7_19765 [Nocardia sp. NPDC060256]|uniref:hypothetical protein n=1 Tax=unclassified Nocardia TaxID=2637762 RepID=UPI00365F4312